MPAIRTHETSHMGGDVFVIHTLKSKAVVSYFFSSVTQARIITVQLLARVAAAGRMASVGRSVGCFVGQVNQPSTAASAGYSQSGAKL